MKIRKMVEKNQTDSTISTVHIPKPNDKYKKVIRFRLEFLAYVLIA